MSEELKQRAREICEQLAALDASKKAGTGVHGQVIGCEPWVIRTNGYGLQCLYEAQALLHELLDPFDQRATPSSPSTASEVGEQSEWQMYADKFGVDPETIDYDSEQWKGFIAGIECARAALAAKTATTMEKTVAQEGEE